MVDLWIRSQNPTIMVLLNSGVRVGKPYAFSSLVCFTCRTEWVDCLWSHEIDLFEDLKKE